MSVSKGETKDDMVQRRLDGGKREQKVTRCWSGKVDCGSRRASTALCKKGGVGKRDSCEKEQMRRKAQLRRRQSEQSAGGVPKRLPTG